MTSGALGDFLRAAWAVGSRDPETVAAIRDMLGLRRPHPLAEAISSLPPRQSSFPPSGAAAKPRVEPASETANATAGRADGADRTPSDRLPARLTQTRQGGGRQSPPVWLAAPVGEAPSAEPASDPPEIAPLFGGVTASAILAAVLSTEAPEGDLDLDPILDRISRRMPFAEIPRRPIPTLRRGVQLLLDVGHGMDPFALDQKSFVASLRRVVPDDRIELLHFVGCPSRRCGAGPRKNWSPWRPPAHGTPVLALTDLGIGGSILDAERSGAAEWLEFALRVKAFGCRLAGLVPYSADRWPPGLARAMQLLHWSERTSARQIRHARRSRR
jgi:hypothetical protein